MMSVGTSVRVITAILLTQSLLTKCDDSHEIEHGRPPFSMDHLDHFGHMDHLDDGHHIVQSEHSYHIGELDHSDLLDHLDAVGGNNPELMTKMLQSSHMSKQISNNNNNNNIIRSVEVVHHDGDSITKYETTHHDDDMFDDTLIPSISSTKKPLSFTKVVKKTVIKRGGKNAEQSSALGSSRSANEMIGNGNLNVIGMDNKMMSKSQTVSQTDRTGNVRTMPAMSVKQGSELSGDLQNTVRTTVTKTTTTNGGGLLNNSEDETSVRGTQGLINSIPSNNVISTISSLNSDYSDMPTDGLRSSSMDGDGSIKTISTMAMMNGNGPNDIPRKQIPRKEMGSFKRMKTTIIKHESTHDHDDDDEDDDDNDDDDHHGDFNEHGNSFNTEIVRPTQNIVATMNPSGYNQMKKTSMIIGDDSNTDTQIGSDSQTDHQSMPSTLFSGLNLSQNQDTSRQTQTNIVKQPRANDETDFNDLNGQMMGLNSNDKMGQLNDNMNLNYAMTSTNQDNGGMMSTNNMENMNGFMPGGYTLTTHGVNSHGFKKMNGKNRMKKVKNGRSNRVVVKKITYNSRTKNGKRNGGRNMGRGGGRNGGMNVKRKGMSTGMNGNGMGMSTVTNGNGIGMNKGMGGEMGDGMSGGMSGGKSRGMSGSRSSGGMSGGGGRMNGGRMNGGRMNGGRMNGGRMNGSRSGGGMSGSKSSGGMSGSGSSGGMSVSGSGGGMSGSGSDEGRNMVKTTRSSGQQNVGAQSYSSKVYVIKSPETSSFTKSYTHESNAQGHKKCNCNGPRSLDRREVSGESATGTEDNHGPPAGTDDDRFSGKFFDNQQMQQNTGDSPPMMHGFPPGPPAFFNKQWKSIKSHRMTNAQHRGPDSSDQHSTHNQVQGARHFSLPGPGPHQFPGARHFSLPGPGPHQFPGARHFSSSSATGQHPPPPPPGGPRPPFGQFKNGFSKNGFSKMMFRGTMLPPPPPPPHGFMDMQSDHEDQMDDVGTVTSAVHQRRDDRGGSAGSGNFGFKQIFSSANSAGSAGSATMNGAHGNDEHMMMSNTSDSPIVSGYTKIIKTTKTVNGDNSVPEIMDVAHIQSMMPAGSYSDDSD